MRSARPERKVTENRFGQRRERVKVLTIEYHREFINITKGSSSQSIQLDLPLGGYPLNLFRSSRAMSYWVTGYACACPSDSRTRRNDEGKPGNTLVVSMTVDILGFSFEQ